MGEVFRRSTSDIIRGSADGECDCALHFESVAGATSREVSSKLCGKCVCNGRRVLYKVQVSSTSPHKHGEGSAQYDDSDLWD